MDSPANPSESPVSIIEQIVPDASEISTVAPSATVQEGKEEEEEGILKQEQFEGTQLQQEEEQEQEQEQEEQEQEQEQEEQEQEEERVQQQSISQTLDPEPESLAFQPDLSAPSATKASSKKIIKPRTKPGGIYTQSVISRRITLKIENIGRTLKQNLENLVASEIEGKCIVEGFIRPGSTKLLTYNSGLIKNGRVIFEVIFECLSCCPVEGMLIDCIARNITKAGIRAELGEDISPVVIFIARDHNYLSDYFNSISENDNIKVRVIGQRFELNDRYVSVIAEIVEQKEFTQARPKRQKPKLVLN